MNRGRIKILKSIATYTETIRKSRFDVCAGYTRDIEHSMEFVDRFRDDKATHNAYAFIGDETARYNDDGEVSGTAGKPILSAIERQEFQRTIVLVRRYYGGIKLGIPGLIRAYGGAAANCLKSASIRMLEPVIELHIQVPFGWVDTVFRFLCDSEFKLREKWYDAKGLNGLLTIEASCFKIEWQRLNEISRGRVRMLDKKQIDP